MQHRIKGVLFDLDGTLLDTAHDFHFILNEMRATRAQPAIDLQVIRPIISQGAGGMLRGVFPAASKDEAAFEVLLAEFFDLYTRYLSHHTQFMLGAESLLESLDTRGIPWGIVTNKSERFAEPLVAQMGLASRTRCLVCGDTLAESKPHPAPLLAAATQLGLLPTQIVYCGDAQRDIESAQRAGMPSIAALFGYITAMDIPEQWAADHYAYRTSDILEWVLDHRYG